MEYNVKLNKKDVVEIIAKNFNTESKNVSFNDASSNIEVNVSYNKDVKPSSKKIGFM